MTSKHPGQHSGDLFRRGRVDPCGGWFGWWYWRFLDESLGIFTECLIKRDLAGHMNGVDLAIMHLVRGHQTDPRMVMVLVVPVEELAAEASGVLDTAEASWEARLILQQGCSTLSTVAPLEQGIEATQSGGVSVLAEGADLVAAQNVVAEAAQPGEDTRVVANA